MAATWIRPIHKTKSKTVTQTLIDRIGYAENPDKTVDYQYVYAYGCDYATAASEFALAKTVYERQTGRGRGGDDVLAYHIRISFKPGGITPEKALEIGTAVTQKYTHGKHQFVVAVHTDKAHTHCHCVFSAVNIDGDHKFRDVRNSAKVIRRISDQLCLENGLSIIENPSPSRGRDYAKYVGGERVPRARDTLQDLIDANLVVGQSFGEFLVKLKRAGCEVKTGKHTAVRLPDGKKNIRFDSLDEGYTEAAINERLRGTLVVAPKVKANTNVAADVDGKTAEYVTATRSSNAPDLLIDIQEKVREGKGAGFEHWAKLFNLKQSSKTLIFLQENGLNKYDELKAKASETSGRLRKLTAEIRDCEMKQADITELQKHIGTYQKTRAVFEAYRKSNWSRKFYDAHTADIILHRAAKKYFDSQNLGGKLPPIATLKQEWATLESQKKLAYKGYYALKEHNKELQTALANVDEILRGQTPREPERQTPKKSHGYDAR